MLSYQEFVKSPCPGPKKRKSTCAGKCFRMEAPSGFEPENRGFAVPCLTAWLWRHQKKCGWPTMSGTRSGAPPIPTLSHRLLKGRSFWSGQRDSNSLPPPWQGGALPDELCPHAEKRSHRMPWHPMGMVPPVGVEPTTRGFSVRCSTY